MHKHSVIKRDDGDHITVWVDNGSERGNHGHRPDSIDLTIADVGEWLEQMLGDEE